MYTDRTQLNKAPKLLPFLHNVQLREANSLTNSGCITGVNQTKYAIVPHSKEKV